MSMATLLETSLNYQDQCPKCGRNWKQLKDALETASYDSDDWQYAVKALQNCDVCEARFKRALKWL